MSESDIISDSFIKESMSNSNEDDAVSDIVTKIISDENGMPIGVKTGTEAVDKLINTWMMDCNQRAKERMESSDISKKIKLCKERSAERSAASRKRELETRERFEQTMREMYEEDAELDKRACTVS